MKRLDQEPVELICSYCGKKGTAKSFVVSRREAFCGQEHCRKFWLRIMLLDDLAGRIATQLFLLTQGVRCLENKEVSSSLNTSLRSALLEEFQKHTLYLNETFSELLCYATMKRSASLSNGEPHFFMREVTDAVELEMLFQNRRVRGPASYYLLEHTISKESFGARITMESEQPVYVFAIQSRSE